MLSKIQVGQSNNSNKQVKQKKQKCDALFEETEQQVIRVDLMDKISNKKDQTYYLQKFWTIKRFGRDIWNGILISFVITVICWKKTDTFYNRRRDAFWNLTNS